MSLHHPKHASLVWDDYAGKWEIRNTKRRSTRVCAAAWCKNPPACEFRKDRAKEYYYIHCHKCRSRMFRANDPVRYAYEDIKHSARKRNIAFSITFGQFKRWCEETGYAETKGVTRLKFHCDRINPTLGYTLENIQCLREGDNIRKRNTDKQQYNTNNPF